MFEYNVGSSNIDIIDFGRNSLQSEKTLRLFSLLGGPLGAMLNQLHSTVQQSSLYFG